MTIKEFSKLCGCNPQTLRYYDHQNLLKPVRVDKWSGYRFYDEEQALIFVKIKNLQRAGFTIQEIKVLLHKEDTEIYRAFDLKIAEEEKRIREIKEIQKAYQTEIISMEKKLETLREKIREAREIYEPAEEFGIDKEDYAEVLETLDSMLSRITESGDLSRLEFNEYAEDETGTEERYFEGVLNNPDYEIVFERHGWKYVKDFWGDLPVMDVKTGYLLLFRLDVSKTNKMAFANTVIGICCAHAESPLKIGCTVLDSQDGNNHFWLVTYEDTV